MRATTLAAKDWCQQYGKSASLRRTSTARAMTTTESSVSPRGGRIISECMGGSVFFPKFGCIAWSTGSAERPFIRRYQNLTAKLRKKNTPTDRGRYFVPGFGYKGLPIKS